MNLFRTKQCFRKLYHNLCASTLVQPSQETIKNSFVRLKGYPSTTFFFCFIKQIKNKKKIFLSCELCPQEFEPLKCFSIDYEQLQNYILDVSNLRFTAIGLKKFVDAVQLIHECYAYKPVFLYNEKCCFENPMPGFLSKKELDIDTWDTSCCQIETTH